MSTTEGATLALLVLSAGGILPALALARMRLVVIPLIPLCGTVIASLAVTGMTAIGGTVVEWYIALSVIGAAVVSLCWWRYPEWRPWRTVTTAHRNATRWMNLAAGLAGLVVCVLCLTVLKSQTTGYDTRDIWLMHPLWYLQGHNMSVAVLRDAVYGYGHPPYPPLTGGAVALAWLVAGVHSYRLGVVMIALLNTLAIFAAATAMVELAGRLADSTDNAVRRMMIRVTGIATLVGVMIVSFQVAGGIIANGYADVLWSAAAVGAVAYGLMLPIDARNFGAAAVLVSVAGLTKLEGSVTAAAIVGLMGVRYFLAYRSDSRARPLLRAGALAVSLWTVIGVWPIVIRLLGARPDVPFGGARRGTDSSRLASSVHVAIQTTGDHFAIIGAGALIALAGLLFLRKARRSGQLGNDIWAWLVIGFELAVIFGAYVVGPGHVTSWVTVTIRRTTTFPLLEAWWIGATWVVLSVCGDRSPATDAQPVGEPVPADASSTSAT